MDFVLVEFEEHFDDLGVADFIPSFDVGGEFHIKGKPEDDFWSPLGLIVSPARERKWITENLRFSLFPCRGKGY